jgi:hypothetical protein
VSQIRGDTSTPPLRSGTPFAFDWLARWMVHVGPMARAGKTASLGHGFGQNIPSKVGECTVVSSHIGEWSNGHQSSIFLGMKIWQNPHKNWRFQWEDQL